MFLGAVKMYDFYSRFKSTSNFTLTERLSQNNLLTQNYKKKLLKCCVFCPANGCFAPVLRYSQFYPKRVIQIDRLELSTEISHVKNLSMRDIQKLFYPNLTLLYNSCSTSLILRDSIKDASVEDKENVMSSTLAPGQQSTRRRQWLG